MHTMATICLAKRFTEQSFTRGDNIFGVSAHKSTPTDCWHLAVLAYQSKERTQEGDLLDHISTQKGFG